jgi:hypothetical protein
VYMAVYKGVPMDEPDEKDAKPKRRNPFWWLGRRVKQKRDEAEAESEKDESDSEKDEAKPAATSGAD